MNDVKIVHCLLRSLLCVYDIFMGLKESLIVVKFYDYDDTFRLAMDLVKCGRNFVLC